MIWYLIWREAVDIDEVNVHDIFKFLWSVLNHAIFALVCCEMSGKREPSGPLERRVGVVLLVIQVRSCRFRRRGGC